MNITKVSIIDNKSKIELVSDDYVPIKSFLELKHSYAGYDKRNYFEVTSSTPTEDGKLLLSAKEVGYWSRKLDRLTNLDPRTFIGKPVTLVTDEAERKRINLESCWM